MIKSYLMLHLYLIFFNVLPTVSHIISEIDLHGKGVSMGSNILSQWIS